MKIFLSFLGLVLGLSLVSAEPGPSAKLPRLVDLGAGKCIPCKQMKPVLEELTKEYAGQFDVEFIDVWENEAAGKKYGVRMIPTQIFYGAEGKELFRHEGFFSKKEILAKWTELGLNLTGAKKETAAIFTWLTDALSGTPWLAILAAAGWGVASLVLSPCHLSSIPLIVGFIVERKTTTQRQAAGYGVLFALGILISIVSVGAVTAAAGHMIGDMGPWANYVVAVVLALVGLHLVGLVKLPWENGLSLPRYHGKAAALLIGLIFGVALGPCTFAYLAPVLGVVFTVARSQPAFATLLLLSYAVGHCALIVAASASTERVQKVLNWHGNSRGATWMRRICGVLVLGAAGWMVFTAR